MSVPPSLILADDAADLMYVNAFYWFIFRVWNLAHLIYSLLPVAIGVTTTSLTGYPLLLILDFSRTSRS